MTQSQDTFDRDLSLQIDWLLKRIEEGADDEGLEMILALSERRIEEGHLKRMRGYAIL